MMVGTVSYMPPEQATGGEIAPRADLYSLGAMLYEMVTGRPPFLGDDEIAIIGQHINTPPVAPTWHNSACPRPLEALIMRLLSKDPSERPESAQDVFNALDAIDLAARGETVEREGTSLESLAGGVFVGRQAEMDQLKAALEDVLGGRGRLVTLVGEPGIGKTRTSEELATYAGLRGATVLWGRCYETGGQPPYWPWVQAIRSYVREIDPDELRRQMGSSASVVAEIVTDVRDRLPELQPPPHMDDPDSARFRLFDSIASFLKTASQARPLVIVLDDLHWSDRPSLAFLEFMARELNQSRVLLICTYRDMELNRRHPLTITLGDLARERLYERVLLRGLTEHDIARFIEIAVGFTAPAELSATVYRHTEGNPLFVTEVVRELVQSGELDENRVSGASTWSVRIPEGVREVIGRRLDRLSERANEMLTIAAVVGRDFRLDVLKELTEDTTEGQLLDVLDEALQARIIEELPDEVGHYQFTHALMQETLTGELSTTRRVRMHARIGETLERLYGDDIESRAAELAYHFAEAEAHSGGEKLVRYSLIAGRNALNSYGFEEAVGHFERGLAAHDADDTTAADLNVGLAQAMMHTLTRDELQRAADALTLALGQYRAAGAPQDTVIDALAQLPLLTAQGISGLVALFEQAIPTAAPGTPRYLDLVIGLANWLKYETYDNDRTIDLSDQVLKAAVSAGDELRELRALILRSPGPAEITDSRDEIDRMKELVDRVDDPISQTYACAIAAGHATWIDRDMPSARAWVQRGIDIAIKSRSRWIIATAYADLAHLNVIDGKLDDALSAVDSGMTYAENEVRLITPGVYASAFLGDVVRCREYINRLDRIPDRTWDTPSPMRTAANSTVVASWIIGEDLLVDTIIDRVRRAVEHSDERRRPAFMVVAGDFLGVAAAIRDETDTVRRFYKEASVRGIWAYGLPSGNWLAPPAIGFMAAHLGLYDEAEEHYNAALHTADRWPSPTLRAFTLILYAELLLDRDEPGDREKAIELQDEALAITQELGMRPLTERILARREILRA